MSESNASIIAFVCCLAGAALEGWLSGSGARMRFTELKMPKYSPPFWLWIVIGIGYYVMCFVLLRKLFGTPQATVLWWIAMVLILLLLAGNAVWNYLFFRLRSLRLCVWAFVPYGLIVIALAVVLAFLHPAGSLLVFCYGLYLAYAAWWTHRLLKCNS